MLVDLPTELLRDIFIRASPGFASTLRALMLTCKRFHHIVEEHLYPEYNLRTADNQYELLTDFVRRPHLRPLVRSLDIKQDAYPERRPRSQNEVTELMAQTPLPQDYSVLGSLSKDLERDSNDAVPALLVTLLPRIERLRYTIGDKLQPYKTATNSDLMFLLDKAGELPSPNHATLSSLFTSLSLIHISINAEYRVNTRGTFMAITSLRKVYLKGVIWRYLSGFWECGLRASPVENLNVDSLRINALHGNRRVFESFIALKRLRLDLRRIDLAQNVSSDPIPKLVQVLEATQKDSLETLELYINWPPGPEESDEYRYVDGSSITSLKKFTRLRNLTLPDVILCGTPPHDFDHHAEPPTWTLQFLDDMLPASLEHLTHVVYEAHVGGESSWRRVWGGLNPG
ncbi:hypothetical protein CC80DRAFT_498914 [Byssothecium circinans]|uniref:F-box domain-containing protein n=1 Tax=Byssothecium circinans TaxID=147558 RepID=A0A6A5UIJ8_9PLEO|nr:hypothetical protein CC80DRAFT_498914 [Byssothecium circinans]